jgi:diguanylate cyclase (GGDEF)-like protein
MAISLPIALLFFKDSGKLAFFKLALKNSFKVVQTEDSESTIEWIKSTPIEIIILESQALDSPLSELCANIQKASKNSHIPILLLSNSLKKSLVLDALSAGVSDFLHEPLEELEVHERIAVALKSKLINKKMKIVTNKIKTAPLLPQNTRLFLDRTLIRDKTLKTITAVRKGAPPLSVLMVHVDTLSRLKQNLGEQAVGEVLTFIESFLKGRLRKYDTLIVEGIGQYLMLLPKTSQSAGRVMAEDIRKEISRTTIATSLREVLVTVSIGVVSFEKELSKSAKAFEQFDLCLERVKKSLAQTAKKGNMVVIDNSKGLS